MPLLDAAAMNESLDSDYDTRNILCRLFIGNPKAGGVEIDPVDNPGYEPFASAPADREPSDGGVKLLCTASWTATDAWDDEPDYLLIEDSDTDVRWDYMPLDEFVVEGPGTIEKDVEVFHGDATEEP